ncbi:MAG: hypothetical protein N7Q72_00950 [Spiroplasma sp. Tabriz.8]|nr:hypothetical protein [Spiroplasma sp. Tabriz.8]
MNIINLLFEKLWRKKIIQSYISLKAKNNIYIYIYIYIYFTCLHSNIESEISNNYESFIYYLCKWTFLINRET